jgi:hypothetical protein
MFQSNMAHTRNFYVEQLERRSVENPETLRLLKRYRFLWRRL